MGLADTADDPARELHQPDRQKSIKFVKVDKETPVMRPASPDAKPALARGTHPTRPELCDSGLRFREQLGAQLFKQAGKVARGVDCIEINNALHVVRGPIKAKSEKGEGEEKDVSTFLVRAFARAIASALRNRPVLTSKAHAEFMRFDSCHLMNPIPI